MGTSSSPPRMQQIVLTYEDLRQLPEDGRRYEILEGELHVTPAPTTEHQRISRNLEFLLHEHVTRHDLGEILDAPVDVILDRNTVVEPDLIFVARARLDIIRPHAIEGAPDLVVEILSPSTARRDRGAKQQLYARYGVAHYWRVDASARSLTELVLASGAYELRATHVVGQTFASALFPELTLDLERVFPAPSP